MMNRRQKLVQEQFLNNEAELVKKLEKVYDQAQKDIEDKIRNLNFTINDLKLEYSWLEDDDPEKARIKSMIQSKIYQKNYQEQLKKQVDGILKRIDVAEIDNISDYLDVCYSEAFIGTIFDAHGQGVPVIMPIDQEAMVRAVQLESKISKGLYKRLGEDYGLLKKRITAEISRGISTGMTYGQVATNLKNQTKIGYNNAIRIARTEGHRIQTTATMDAMNGAKERGADVLKQWDATLDGRTRDSHAKVDGEIREVDKPFSNGLMYPGDPHGTAAEVINCRCALLQRARWALDEDELQVLKDRATYYGLDKADELEDFKKKYLQTVNTIATNPSYNDISKKIGLQFFASKEKQFGKKVGKHAYAFGLDPSIPEDRIKFQRIIDNIMDKPDEIRVGDWRSQTGDVLFFIQGENVVVTKQNKEFVTILKGGITNARVKRARKQ